MVPATETRIEVFRQTVERLGIISGQLDTLAVTLARADELPALIARTFYPIERKLLAEEQAAIGHPVRLRIRQSQLESELRQGWLVAIEQLRAATDAASFHVTAAAGGTEVVRTFPFARKHLEELARHRDMPATATAATRLAFLRRAWLTIDAAVASLGEIRFETQRRRESQPQKQQFSSSSTTVRNSSKSTASGWGG